jgi:hypothetical protein
LKVSKACLHHRIVRVQQIENRLLFDCLPLAKRLPETTERDLDRNTYRVELAGHRLVWVTREGDKHVRYNSEPEAIWRASAWVVLRHLTRCCKHVQGGKFSDYE